MCWALPHRPANFVVAQPQPKAQTVTETPTVYWIGNLHAQSKGVGVKPDHDNTLHYSRDKKTPIYREVDIRLLQLTGNQQLGIVPHSPPG